MNKKLVIGLTVAGLIGLGVGIYIYRKRNKKKEVINIDDVNVSDVPPAVQQQVEVKPTPLTSGKNFDSNPAIIELKKDLGRGYYVIEILDNKNGVVINKMSGKPVSDGLDTGSWMQMVRKLNDFKNKFLSQPNSQEVKVYGLQLIAKLGDEVERIFSSPKYSVNNQWYKDYLAKGGDPLPPNVT